MTDARLFARHLEWASTSEGGRNHGFNIVNGDVFRWKWMGSRIADYFGAEAVAFDGEVRPLESRMRHAGTQRKQIAARLDLVEADIDRIAAWWH
jgi:hypothetical protein